MGFEDLDGVPAAFEDLAEDLVALQKRINEAHQKLSVGVDLSAERAAAELRKERDDKLLQWATLGLRWRLAGGAIHLEDGDEENTIVAIDDGVRADDSHTGTDVGALAASLASSSAWDQGGASYDLDAAQAVVDRLGAPAAGDEHEDLLGEANRLNFELTQAALWKTFPRSVQHALTGVFASRLRRLQDDTPPRTRAVLALQLKKNFSKLTQFSSDAQPGWVAGLSRHHHPEHGSWLEDAAQWWQQLQSELSSLLIEASRAGLNPEVALNALGEAVHAEDSIEIRRAAVRALNAGVDPEDLRLARPLAPWLEALEGDKSLKKLRKAVRKHAAEQSSAEGALPAQQLPLDWAWFERTRGKKAVIVGGDPREQRRVALEAAFEFSSLEWTNFDVRAVQQLGQRVEGGSVEFVVLLGRYINHKITDILLPCCRAARVDWVIVKQGYGINQVRLAIERYVEVP